MSSNDILSNQRLLCVRNGCIKPSSLVSLFAVDDDNGQSRRMTGENLSLYQGSIIIDDRTAKIDFGQRGPF